MKNRKTYLHELGFEENFTPATAIQDEIEYET